MILFMELNELEAISTAVIAFITVLALMVAFYYNLKSSRTKTEDIIFLELIIILTVIVFIKWVINWLKINWLIILVVILVLFLLTRIKV